MILPSQVTIENLISTGAHFGHLTRRWHPNYKPFIYMEKNGIHIIDIKQTIDCLQRALVAVTKIVQNGGTVLFVGTKKQAKDVLQREADRCGMYYVVERWLGGTLTNFATIKRSIKRLQQLEKDADTLYQTLTKKEILRLERERIRLADQHRGIKDMKQLPDFVYVVDTQYEATAIRESRRLEIPIIAIVDSNTDPTLVDYPIPANDDSLRTIQLITSAIADTIISARGGQSFEIEGGGEDIETTAVEPDMPAQEEKEAPVEPEEVADTSDDTSDESKVSKDETPAVDEGVTLEEGAGSEVTAETEAEAEVEKKAEEKENQT